MICVRHCLLIVVLQLPLFLLSQTVVTIAKSPAINIPLAVENCTNGIDDDGDGFIDCADADCLDCGTVCGPLPSLNPKIFNTGNNGQGGLIPTGAQDLHWTVSNTLVGTQRKAIYTGNCNNGYWTPSPYPDAGWITDPQYGVCGFIFPQNDSTPRFFSTQFELSASLASSLILSFDAYADNYIGEVYLNGVPKGIKKLNGDAYCSGCNVSFTLNDGFVSGTNTITVRVVQKPIPENPIGQQMGFLLNASASLDSDKDGIVDGKDKCPGTPLGVSVDANGCFAVTISANKNLCEGDSLSLKSSSAGDGSIYEWLGPNGEEFSGQQVGIKNVSLTNAGSYSLKIIDKYNCVRKNSIYISVSKSPSATITADTTICRGTALQLNAYGGTSYLWSFSSDLSATNISNPVAQPSKTTSYDVEITNSGGCKKKVSTTVIVNQPSPVNIVSPEAICSGGSAQLNATGSILYKWYPTTGLSNANISNPVASPLSTTKYTIVGSAENGCKDSSRVTVVVQNSSLPVTISPNAFVCIGDSSQLNVSGGETYKWSPDIGLNNPNIQNPKAAPGTTTTYKVMIGHSNGCNNSASTQITVYDKPVALVNASSTICVKDTIQLNASGGITYLWQPAIGLSNGAIADPKAFPSATTNYSVVVTNKDGCQDTAFTGINIIPKPLLFLGKDTTICISNSIKFDASLPDAKSYLWNTGAQSPAIDVIKEGQYIVSVEIDGCLFPAKDTIQLYVSTLPTILPGKDTSICSFNPIKLFANGNNISTYLWNTGSVDSFIIVNKEGVYSVVASNQCGSAIDEVSVKIEECSDDVFFPTAFTPTGDGKNELFKAMYFPGINLIDYELKVFNRWGEVVFETKNPSKGWNGIYKGKIQNTNTFVWYARYKKGSASFSISKKGTVTLIQ